MDVSKLVTLLMGEVVIAIGVPLFCIARYFSAPDEKKKRRAHSIKIVAIVWMAVGVLIYLRVIISLINKH